MSAEVRASLKGRERPHKACPICPLPILHIHNASAGTLSPPLVAEVHRCGRRARGAAAAAHVPVRASSKRPLCLQPWQWDGGGGGGEGLGRDQHPG